MSTKSRQTSNTNVQAFENFFQGWLIRQENYRDHLRSTLQTIDEFVHNNNNNNNNERVRVQDEDLRDLVLRVLAHYQQYYEEKSRIANHDVSLVFSPPWFSCFEQSFFWIAGFKPGLAFRIVTHSVSDMSMEQVERMERLRTETREEERKLDNETARIQESVAAPAIVEVTRRGERLLEDGRYDDMEAAVEVLKGEMEVVVANADMLRTRTAERVVELLSPVQNVRFLAAVAELQMKIRIWGWQIDGESRR